MKFHLRHGAEIDTLTANELAHHLNGAVTQWIQEMARGKSTSRFESSANVTGGTITLPAVGQPKIGPEVGFAWTIQRISAFGLAANDVLSVYRNTAIPANFLGTITAANNFHVGSKGALLRGDEKLVITGASLTATGEVTVNGEATEIGERDVWKLI